MPQRGKMTEVEVLTFQKPSLPKGYLTTHVKMSINGNLVRVYEANGLGGKNCPRLALEEVVTNAGIDLNKVFRRTEYGYRKTFKEHPLEVAKKLDALAEAVYKPGAHELKVCSRISKENYIGVQTFIGMIGAKFLATSR